MKENGFSQKKFRIYSIETITNVDNVDDQVLLANIPTRTNSLLHSLEQVERGIGLDMNFD